MKTIQINLYQYSELSDKAKEKARNWWLSCMDTADWYDPIKADAEEIGLEITSVDCHHKTISGSFNVGPFEVTNRIEKNHGKGTSTYKTAKTFLDDYNALVEKHSDGITLDVVVEEKENDFDDACTDLVRDFTQSLLEDYLQLFINQLEYLESEEAIEEAMSANEYTFLENGKRFG